MPGEDKIQAQGPSFKDRQIRVFISSTFRDMQAERDCLVKFIFPQLRKLCESRGVTWGEVDLRWGVTDEQAAEGKVLPICLEEIKRCRPYFIGLLGERYGWIPESIPAEVIEREPWLNEHLHGEKSVTELEIIHGVLRKEKMHGHAFFYFRDPEFVKTVPPEQHQNFVSENDGSAEKLRRMKELIRHAQSEEVCQLHENYPDPKALGELVLGDLTKVVNDNWPEGSQPDPLDREAMDHEAYAQSRERVYIGRQEYFDRLDTHAAANDTQPLVVLGESGSGKSALLANWMGHYRQAHPDALVLQHYIGATPYSADWAAMLRRVMGEFKQRLGIAQDIPDQPDALRSAFPNWLYMAAAKVQRSEDGGQKSEGQVAGLSKIVIVLDGLNQLEDRDGAPDLLWLPPVLPENVRLMVSTLPGRPLDEIQKRHWPTLKVELLSADERRKLIGEYLAQHAKALNAARLERIATAPPSANPLYLRVLLDELRLVRTHEEMEERIGDYLKAESPSALYEKVIVRWEQDYDSDLVRDTLSLLWAARRGLTETELLQALGKDGEPLPRAKWSPLFLAMSDGLVSRGGLLTFAHEFLRKAACEAYLPNAANQQTAHLRLADYFQEREATPRRTDELPWQLAEAKAWERLQALLTDRVFFAEAWERNQFEVKTYWAEIEAGSALRMVEAYHALVESPDSELDKGHLWRLGLLLGDTGHPEEALCLRSALVEYFRETGDLSFLQAALGNRALILQARGELDGAMALHKENERICRQLGNLDGLQATLGNQAAILYARGELDGAMALLKEQQRICRQLGNLDGLQATLGNQANILQMRGDLDGAMALLTEAERIGRQLGDLDGLQKTLGNQALILKARGDLDEAMALLKEQERVCRQLGNLDSLSKSLGNQALILRARGDLDGAMALHKEKERVCRQLGNLDGLQATLGNQAVILQVRGDLDSAMALVKEQERISRQLGNVDGLQTTLGNQALILHARGDLDGAMALLKEQERICRQLGNLDGQQATLGNQALILQDRGELEGAMALNREAERICRRLGNLDSLSISLGNQALILQDRGDLDGAMALHKEKERICRQLGNAEGLAGSLANQSVVLKQMGRAQEGLPLVEEACRIAASHGYTALVEQIEPILNSLRLAAQSGASGQSAVAAPANSPSVSPAPPREPTIPELRDSAAAALKRGLWEASETYLEKLLLQGEPVESVAPDIITALLNAHEALSPATVTRIETLLAQLESSGHTTLSAPLREKLTAKLAATRPKKPWWKIS